MDIVITDLTRFSDGNPNVCIAGINIKTGQCIRPLPYIKLSKCEELNILPGSKLNGSFEATNGRGCPHVEDMNYETLTYLGKSSSKEFREVLTKSLSKTISDGFKYSFSEGEKVIPYTNAPNQSIITLKIKPSQIKIVKDAFKEGKIKLIFTDSDGKKYNYLPITDLGFYNYAMKHFGDKNFSNKINDFIGGQEDLYLRIGLSGGHKSQDGREGYWLQVNGIYTFPNYSKEIRNY